MEELIGRIVAAVGIDQALAEKAVGIILGFLNREAPEGDMQALLAKIPGAAELVAGSGGGGGGGLLSGFGGMGGAMAAMSQLTSAGLDMGEVQGVTRELVGFAKEKAGEDAVNRIIGSIPGLGQFV